MKKGAALLVAGTQAGTGKTTVACAILAALRKRGQKAQPFKAGPDFLDPEYLSLAAGRPCVNLDLWMMPPEAVRGTFAGRLSDADVGIVDGMKGLFDGMTLEGTGASSADLAQCLELPVLLVIDAPTMAESAAAVAHGFASFGKTDVVGVIFNRVLGPAHYGVLKGAVEGSKPPRPKVFGWLSQEANLEIPGRRQGLVNADARRAGELLPGLAELAEKTVDLDGLLAAARAPGLSAPKRPRAGKARVKIAVARDEAFHFYYEDNLEALRTAGAEIVPFSPLSDRELPRDAAGLYLGGGFAESHAGRLEENRTMRESVRAAVGRGLPTYAECGGVMYLSSHLVGTGVRAWEMVGAIPGEVRLERGAQRYGYVTARTERETFLVKKGETLRGHEFQQSVWSAEGGEGSIYRINRPGQTESRSVGFGGGALHASYVHLHFSSVPQVAERFVQASEKFAKTAKKKR